MPADHADPLAWRVSYRSGGSPGTHYSLEFSSWAAANGLDTGASLDVDPDLDGLNNLLEYALASNPAISSVGDLPAGALALLDPGTGPADYLTITFRRQTLADDLAYAVEVSSDLETWRSGEAVRVSSTERGDGTTAEVWRMARPADGEPGQFMRLWVGG